MAKDSMDLAAAPKIIFGSCSVDRINGRGTWQSHWEHQTAEEFSICTQLASKDRATQFITQKEIRQCYRLAQHHCLGLAHQDNQGQARELDRVNSRQ